MTDRAGFNMSDEHRVHGGIQKIGLTTRNPHVGLVRTFQSTHVISISYLEKNDTHINHRWIRNRDRKIREIGGEEYQIVKRKRRGNLPTQT